MNCIIVAQLTVASVQQIFESMSYWMHCNTKLSKMKYTESMLFILTKFSLFISWAQLTTQP